MAVVAPMFAAAAVSGTAALDAAAAAAAAAEAAVASASVITHASQHTHIIFLVCLVRTKGVSQLRNKVKGVCGVWGWRV